MRSRKKENLNAPIEEGHISCTLVHLANVSYRLGRTLHFDPAKEEVINDAEANRMLRDGRPRLSQGLRDSVKRVGHPGASRRDGIPLLYGAGQYAGRPHAGIGTPSATRPREALPLYKGAPAVRPSARMAAPNAP